MVWYAVLALLLFNSGQIIFGELAMLLCAQRPRGSILPRLPDRHHPHAIGRVEISSNGISRLARRRTERSSIDVLACGELPQDYGGPESYR